VERFWKYKIDHVLFWVITVGFHVYTRMYVIDMAGWPQFLFEVLIRNGLLAIIIYANIEYLMPVLAQQQKLWQYVAGLALCFVFYILVKNTHDYYLSVFTGKSPLPFWRYSFYNFSLALFYLTFSLALQLSKEWYFQRRRLREMEMEKLHTELEYLKSQINPHFLFNSLNTIFFQIDKNNATARDTLTKFSDMLRFQLYECNGHEIPLEREIQYLKNYVDLQRLRKDEKYIIEFATHGDLRDKTVAPLLLMPLIENAFKHVSHFPEGGNKISVQIRVLADGTEMNVLNTKETRVTEKIEAGGIGLRNLKRRLELQYATRYELEIKETKREFEVRLKLKR
jgi:two-component system, LytTR family, sensor kinase